MFRSSVGDRLRHLPQDILGHGRWQRKGGPSFWAQEKPGPYRPGSCGHTTSGVNSPEVRVASYPLGFELCPERGLWAASITPRDALSAVHVDKLTRWSQAMSSFLSKISNRTSPGVGVMIQGQPVQVTPFPLAVNTPYGLAAALLCLPRVQG